MDAITEGIALETKVEIWPIDAVIPYDRNPRKITPAAIEKVARSIRKFGMNSPVLVDEDAVLLAGHTRQEAMRYLGAGEIPVIVKYGLSEQEKRAYRIADNRVAEESEWDDDLLKLEISALQGLDGFDIADLGFDGDELNRILSFDGDEGKEGSEGEGGSSAGASGQPGKGSLAARFGVPPFSVLNAREGWWQERKRAWLSIGIQSELGRGGEGQPNAVPGGALMPLERGKAAPGGSLMPSNDSYRKDGGARGDGAGRSSMSKGLAFGEIANYDGADRTINGTSIFDPVLCELAYRWFCPPGGVILDPFAGGSVRGIVASRLGREYHGIDLRAEQVEANAGQLNIAGERAPTWYRGDSRELDSIVPRSVRADLIFTCPPYADLEVYSDDPADLSAMAWPDFLRAYGQIIQAAADRLNPCRFAVFVVGDARGPDGNYYGLPWKTVELCEAAGLRLYNEAVLVTAVGSLPVRAGIPFDTTRKLGKSHQNCLVFIKGDAKAAAKDIGPCEFGESIDDEAAARAAGAGADAVAIEG